MLAGGPLAAHLIAGRASEKLGRPVTIGGGHGGLGAIVLGDVVVAGATGQPPLVTVKEVRIPWGVALGMRGDVRVDGLRIAAVKGGPGDNLSALVDRLRGRSAGKAKTETPDGDGGGSAGASKIPDVVITDGALDARDETKHLSLKIGSFDAELRPGTKLAVRLRRRPRRGRAGRGGRGAELRRRRDRRADAARGPAAHGGAGAARDGGPRLAAADAVAHRHHRRDRAAARGRAGTDATASSSICAAATAARRSRSGRRRGTPISTRGWASCRCGRSSSRWGASATCCRRRC